MPPEKSDPPPHSKPVTLQVIADHAGVTRALVSMALRNSPKVAAKTKVKIQALAEELGYRPNPMVRALMAGVRGGQSGAYRSTLAFVTNFPTEDRWRELHTYPNYFKGAVERGQALGYQVEHFWLGEYQANPSRFADILRARGITGLLIAPLPRMKCDFSMNLAGFSAVTLGYSLAAKKIHRVCNHHYETVQAAVAQLSQRGYKRIGFAISEKDNRQVNCLWTAGLHAAHHRLPELDFSIMDPGDWSREAFMHWYQRDQPEVIIAVNQEVWSWAEQLGESIPDTLGFFHLDCRQADRLSGMYQNTKGLGAAAVEMLAGLVESNVLDAEQDSRVLMLHGDFHPGATLRHSEGESSPQA